VGEELLLKWTINRWNIKDINVGQKEIKITQYVDDTMVLVRDCDSVPRLLNF